MIISRTDIEGVAVIDLDLRSDDRGFFARTFCVTEFGAAGLETAVQQSNLSFNHKAGTVRGMHYQVAPHPEAKLVRCTTGAVVDIIVDMRPWSATRLQHVQVELSASNRRALYVPPYFAHGYQTLVDGTSLTYLIGAAYSPDHARTLRWDDPAVGVAWPRAATRISDKDRNGQPWPPVL